MSMRPSSSASSISLVNSPLPPMSASGWFRILSPVVLMMQISSAPSSRSSGNAACVVHASQAPQPLLPAFASYATISAPRLQW